MSPYMFEIPDYAVFSIFCSKKTHAYELCELIINLETLIDIKARNCPIETIRRIIT